MEIRYLAGDVRRRSQDNCADEDLERIRFLADVCHNLPGIARPRPWRPSRTGTSRSSLQQAVGNREAHGVESGIASRGLRVLPQRYRDTRTG
jgi:hypothetical protein